jgi:hypothetical protein
MRNAIRTIKIVGISWASFAFAYGAFKFGSAITTALFFHPSLSH